MKTAVKVKISKRPYENRGAYIYHKIICKKVLLCILEYGIIRNVEVMKSK